MRRLAVLAVAAASLGACAHAGPRVGADLAACRAAVGYSEAHNGASVLVLVDGKPVCEAYGPGAAPDQPLELASGTKGFNGLIAAAAVQDGLLSLDEPVSRTLPEWAADPLKAKATIRHLLSLTVGMSSTIGRPPSYEDAVGLPLNAEPGARFQYGPAPFQVFGEVMKRKLAAHGQAADPVAYLRRRVLAPIGLQNVEWRRDAAGDPLLPQGARLTAREWAQFGEFIRGGARVDGRQIVDPDTFRQLFVGSAANPAYGVTWWLPAAPRVPDPVSSTLDISRHPGLAPADLVIAAGAGDQRLYVVPSLRLTVVRQAPIALQRAGRSGPGPQAERWSDAEFLKSVLPLAVR